MTVSDAAPRPAGNQGQPLPRVAARLKVTGEAKYAADIPVGNLAYGVLVTSNVARGEVTSLDLTTARAIPGVLEILSYEDAGEIDPPAFTTASYTSLGPLHTRKIWHDGQIMALVVAETFEAAEEAAHTVKAQYRTEQPSAELGSAGTETIPAAGNN